MKLKCRFLTALTLASFLVSPPSWAEEGGAGHYAPGTLASLADVALSSPGAAVVVGTSYFYDGDAGGAAALPYGVNAALNVDVSAFSQAITVMWEPCRLGSVDYSFGVCLPFLWMDVSADVNVALGPVTRRIHRSEDAGGLGDIVILPATFGYKTGDIQWMGGLMVYAPTGEYDKSALANLGKNYWTFTPYVGVSWMSQKTGTEFTCFSGVDFNTTNHDTDYRTGNQFHVDATLSQTLPLSDRDFVSLGITGYWYQQITGDSGSGARFGGFEGSTGGLGPLLRYTRPFDKDHVLIIEAKWLCELETTRRPQGNAVFLKVGYVF